MTGPTSEGSVNNKRIVDELYVGEAEILATDTEIKNNKVKTGNNGKKAPEVEVGNIKDISFSEDAVILSDDYAKVRYTTKLGIYEKDLKDLKKLLETKSGKKREEWIKDKISSIQKEIVNIKSELANLELSKSETER